MKASSRPEVSLLRNLVLAAASLLVFLLVSEGLLTLWRPAGGGTGPALTDPIVGFRLRPRHTWREVGGALVRTNARGLREVEFAPMVPPGALRILCLGDSSTFGYGMNAGETYPEDLERGLARRLPGTGIEVINAGVPGWSSANGAALLAGEGMAWKPSVVILSFGYNEQLGSGPGAFHYDFDPARGRVLIHRLGEADRRTIAAPPRETTPPGGTRPGRFEDFPRNLRLYAFTKFLIDQARRLPERLSGQVKSSPAASWVLARVYARDPEQVHRRLRIEVEGNHVLEAYGAALEAMVKSARAGGARPMIMLQPRRAYREFLEWLPEDARRANLEAVALIRRGESQAAIAILEPLRKADPAALITAFNLSVAYREAGRGADADRMIETLLPIRSFTMNALAERTAARLGVPVVYTPLAFEASDAPDLFFPDRYHTRPAGTAMVAAEVEKALLAEGAGNSLP